MPTNAQIQRDITDHIVAALEAGDTPIWQQPWQNIRCTPTSMATGRAYRGSNRWLLSMVAIDRGYSNPWWGTFPQIIEQGGHVRAGQNKANGLGGTTIYLYKPHEKDSIDPATGEPATERYRVGRAFYVYNAQQCEGLPDKFATPEVPDVDQLPVPDEIIRNYCSHDGPELTYKGGNRAHYLPDWDMIELPQPGQFLSPRHLAATSFHEVVHSTGHKSRLDRPGVANFDHFGSDQYSREEMIANLGSAMLRAEAGVDGDDLFRNDVAYIGHWSAALRADPALFPGAATAAQEAADLVMEPTRAMHRSGLGALPFAAGALVPLPAEPGADDIDLGL